LPYRIKSKFHPNEKLCSPKCKLTYKRERNREKRPKTYTKGWDTIKYCKRCGNKIIFDKTKPKNVELRRKYCSSKCRERYISKKFRENNPQRVSRIKKKSYYKHHKQRLIEAKEHKYKRRYGGEKEISKLDEEFIRKRDNHRCVYCHVVEDEDHKLTNDHIIPIRNKEKVHIALLSPENLVTCCFVCNRKKQNLNVDDFFKTKYCIDKVINWNTVNPIIKELIKKQKEQKKLS